MTALPPRPLGQGSCWPVRPQVEGVVLAASPQVVHRFRAGSQGRAPTPAPAVDTGRSPLQAHRSVSVERQAGSVSFACDPPPRFPAGRLTADSVAGARCHAVVGAGASYVPEAHGRLLLQSSLRRSASQPLVLAQAQAAEPPLAVTESLTCSRARVPVPDGVNRGVAAYAQRDPTPRSRAEAAISNNRLLLKQQVPRSGPQPTAVTSEHVSNVAWRPACALAAPQVCRSWGAIPGTPAAAVAASRSVTTSAPVDRGLSINVGGVISGLSVTTPGLIAGPWETQEALALLDQPSTPCKPLSVMRSEDMATSPDFGLAGTSDSGLGATCSTSGISETGQDPTIKANDSDGKTRQGDLLHENVALRRELAEVRQRIITVGDDHQAMSAAKDMRLASLDERMEVVWKMLDEALLEKSQQSDRLVELQAKVTEQHEVGNDVAPLVGAPAG